MKRRYVFAITALTVFAMVGCQDALVGPPLGDAGLNSGQSGKRLDGADQGGRPLYASMTGDQEAPGPGDPDGTGTAVVTLNEGQATVCFELSVADIAPAFAAHIHVAPAGAPGPVVIPLVPPTSGSSSGCVEGVDAELIKAIRQNPDEYYVNVHNADFPPGAVRGQLTK